VLINKKYKNHIKSYDKISGRIMALNINSKPPITIIATYAPTESSKKEQKIKFYEQLEECIKKLQYSITISRRF
jgi:exonuclease III